MYHVTVTFNHVSANKNRARLPPLFAFRRSSAATVDKAPFHYVTNCTFATVRASLNITACYLLPSTGRSLEVAMRCDLLIDNTAEHRQPQILTLLVLRLITVTKIIASNLLLCDVRNNDLEFLWRRHVRVQLLHFSCHVHDP